VAAVIVQIRAREEFTIEPMMGGGRREGQQDREQAPLKIKYRSGSYQCPLVGRHARRAGHAGSYLTSLSVLAIFLEAGEKIKTVEAHTFPGGPPIEAERDVLTLDPPAELPVGLHDEGRNRTLLRNRTDKTVRFCTSEQII
jgi:hypothetical protein